MHLQLVTIIMSVLLFTWSECAYATNYYFSKEGNDQSDGITKATPWRNPNKLSEIRLLPGDSIFLKKGSVFIGQLILKNVGSAQKEVYIGSYGSGEDPVISGAIPLKNWKKTSNTIWEAECLACNLEPGNLFINNVLQPLGRYPNYGYKTLSCSSDCQSLFSDNTLKFADGYWNKAEVVVKSSRWTMDNIKVYNYQNNTFHLSNPSTYALRNGFGYFIQNHISTLDKHGEWYFDPLTKKVFIYFDDGKRPDQFEIAVSTVYNGLQIINSSHIRVENLSFSYQHTIGIRVQGSDHISLSHLKINHSGNTGLEMIDSTNPIVEYCRIDNSNNNGVEWRNNSTGLFHHNSILNTGLHPGRGASGNGTYIALGIKNDNENTTKNSFQYNIIENTGYLGIDFRSGHTSIKNNFISNFCLLKDDGAGIYTWGNTTGDNIIEGNIILNGIGSGQGTPDSEKLYASGIYIDDRSSDIIIKGNTIAGCAAAGIHIHNAKNISLIANTLSGNVTNLFNNERGQLLIKLDNLVPRSDNEAIGIEVICNNFIATEENTYCVFLSAEKGNHLKNLGTFIQNQYCALYKNQVAARFCDHHDLCAAPDEMSLADWQYSTGSDKGASFKILPSLKTEFENENLVKNSSMDNNMDGWITWPEHAVMIRDKQQMRTGPALKVKLPSQSNEVLLYHAGFPLKGGELYRLSFTAKSTSKSRIEFVPLMANSPWGALDQYACFAIDSTYKTFTYFFKPDKNCKEARVNFKSNTTFWIDNVTLHKVTLSQKVEDQVRLIFNTESNPMSVPLNGKFVDLEGNLCADAISLKSYDSKVLLKAR